MLSDSPSGRNDTDGKVGKEELKDKRFAASVEREEVYAGAEKLRVDLTEHITFLIHALVPHAEELHIQGRGP